MLRSAALRSIAVVSSGTIAAQIIVVAASPILSRLYDPGALGVVTVFNSVLGVLIVVAAMRYEFAIPVPKVEREAAAVLVLTFVVLALMCVLGTVGLVALRPVLGGLRDVGGFGWYVVMLPVALASNGAFAILTFWAIRRQTYGLVAKAQLLQAVVQVAAQIALGASGVVPLGLVLGAAIATMVSLVPLVASTWRRDATLVRSVHRSDLRAAARRFRRFPALSGSAAFLERAAKELPFLFFAGLYGKASAGALALAQRVLETPIGLIAAAVSQVYLGSTAATLRESGPSGAAVLRARLRKMLVGMLAVAAPFLLGVLVLGPWVITTIFGDEWRQAGDFARILVVMYVAQGVVSPTGGTLDLLERQDLHIAREFLRISLMIGALLVAHVQDLSANKAAAAFAIAGSVSAASYLGTSMFALRRHGTAMTSVS